MLTRNLAIRQHQAIVTTPPNGQRLASQIDQTGWSANGCTHTFLFYFDDLVGSAGLPANMAGE